MKKYKHRMELMDEKVMKLTYSSHIKGSSGTDVQVQRWNPSRQLSGDRPQSCEKI